jgi:hypothetical protein
MTYFIRGRDAADESRAVSGDDFRYPGPKPQSGEAAIHVGRFGQAAAAPCRIQTGSD